MTAQRDSERMEALMYVFLILTIFQSSTSSKKMDNKDLDNKDLEDGINNILETEGKSLC